MRQWRRVGVMLALGLAAGPAQAVEQGNQPTFGLDRVGWLQGDFGDYPLWQYAAFGVWVLLALVAAPVVDWLVSRGLKRWTAKAGAELYDKLVEILRLPVKVAVVLVMLDIGLNMFLWPPYVQRLLGTLFVVAVAIRLTYDTSPEKMEQAVALLREIFRAHPLTHDVWVYWKEYSPSSLDIQVVYWCKSTIQQEFLQGQQEINLEIKRRFDAAGLEFAFPTQTIHLRSENA